MRLPKSLQKNEERLLRKYQKKKERGKERKYQKTNTKEREIIQKNEIIALAVKNHSLN
jgi:hypothetical protein